MSVHDAGVLSIEFEGAIAPSAKQPFVQLPLCELAPDVSESGTTSWVGCPTCDVNQVCYTGKCGWVPTRPPAPGSQAADRSGSPASQSLLYVDSKWLVDGYPGYVPLVTPKGYSNPDANKPPTNEQLNIPTPAGIPTPDEIPPIEIVSEDGRTRIVYYQYTRFIDQPAFRAIRVAEKMTHEDAGAWQKAVRDLHLNRAKNNSWPSGWCIPTKT